MTVVTRLASGAIVVRRFVDPFERPDRLPRALLALAPWGTNLAGLVAGAAGRYPDRIAVHDDTRATTYRELWRRTASLAAGLDSVGIGPGQCVGLLARNHRGFIESLAAIAATGADAVLLNTGFAGPQLANVVAHEGIGHIIHDDEFASVVDASGVEHHLGEALVDEFAARGLPISARRRAGRLVILTSGTTGRPKGAARTDDAGAVDAVAALLDRVPLRLGDTQVVAAPLFHAWGLSNILLGLARCTTNVLARRFDPGDTLRATAEHGADVLVVVPVMLARILELSTAELDECSTPHLRVIASSGSAIGTRLTTDVLERFGPVLYNLYGSTEVAIATIATPDDLVDTPSTAGRVARGVTVEILDDEGAPVPDGSVGRVFVGGSLKFGGYTGGGDKETRRGLVSSGDLGRFRDGLLFIEGRDDDMIVSGGENVFPIEVEDLLARHPTVAHTVVVGEPDDEFGEALTAFVVVRAGHSTSVDELRSYVRDHLARHKVPRRVVFVDDIPRNPAGKVLRGALRDGYGDPQPK